MNSPFSGDMRYKYIKIWGVHTYTVYEILHPALGPRGLAVLFTSTPIAALSPQDVHVLNPGKNIGYLRRVFLHGFVIGIFLEHIRYIMIYVNMVYMFLW